MAVRRLIHHLQYLLKNKRKTGVYFLTSAKTSRTTTANAASNLIPASPLLFSSLLQESHTDIGWGMYAPEEIRTNADIAQMVDTNDEWIVSRTDIRERRIAAEDENTAAQALAAAREALEVADLDPADLDLIIVAFASLDNIFPAAACLVQDALGAANAGAFDLSAACTGWMYGLNMAAQAIRTGSINHALIIGSETLSRFVNWQDRDTCILFGDGAGAVVLGPSERPGGVLSTVMGADGSSGETLSIPAGGARLPASAETVANGLHYIQMDGRQVFRFATRVMRQGASRGDGKGGFDHRGYFSGNPPSSQYLHHRIGRPRA